jgi:hypothetical protein
VELVRRCICGDKRRAHEHYRPGLECARCGCMGFRWRWLHLRAWRIDREVRNLWNEGM